MPRPSYLGRESPPSSNLRSPLRKGRRRRRQTGCDALWSWRCPGPFFLRTPEWRRENPLGFLPFTLIPPNPTPGAAARQKSSSSCLFYSAKAEPLIVCHGRARVLELRVTRPMSCKLSGCLPLLLANCCSIARSWKVHRFLLARCKHRTGASRWRAQPSSTTLLTSGMTIGEKPTRLFLRALFGRAKR